MGLCDMCGRSIEGTMQIGDGKIVREIFIVCRNCFGDLQIVREKRRAEARAEDGLNKIYTGRDYLIRDIPEELVNKALRRADKDGDCLRDLTVKAMQAYLMEKGGE